MKYIYNHLGLGDHIICNGLYRELIVDNEEYIIFTKYHNYDTVSFMLRDLKNISYLCVDTDNDVIQYINTNQITNDLIIIGFSNDNIKEAESFDDYFYLQHNIPFNKRWDSFKVDRDIESELELFKKFNVKEGEYVFIHDDISRGYEIDLKYIENKNLPIIKPIIGLTKNSFDYCYLMEHSKESHFIDSSFRMIFDSLKLRDINIFFHENLKNGVKRGGNAHDILKFKKI